MPTHFEGTMLTSNMLHQRSHVCRMPIYIRMDERDHVETMGLLNSVCEPQYGSRTHRL